MSSLALLLAALVLPQTPAQAPPQRTLVPDQPLSGPPSGIIAGKLVDQAGGALEASSIPTLGALYPLTDKLFVDPVSGHVGVGTTTPDSNLSVEGSVEFGHSQFVAFSTSSILGGSSNEVNGVAGTVAGGAGNQILNNADFSFIGGGMNNDCEARFSFIGGGAENWVRNNSSTEYQTIAGGNNNRVDATGGAVGGGANNFVIDEYGAIAGGAGNTAGLHSFAVGQNCDASSSFSFAAGIRAEAQHDGSFVWADGVDPNASFATTGPNQFLVRATGGVGIGTNAPVGALDVAGAIRSSGPSGGAVAFSNPLNSSASATLGWLNDVARIRIGGTGAGAQNGFDFQTVGNSSLLRIAGNGKVTAKGEMHATAFVQTSDARLKTEVRELEGAMDVVRSLRGVSFAWDPERMPEAGDQRQVGFLAQEVREVLPEAVHEDAEGSLAVAYTQVVPVLVEALKQQDQHLRALEARLLALETVSRDPH